MAMSWMRPMTIAAAALVALLALCGCGDGTAVEVAADAGEAAADGAERAPTFTLTDLRGEAWRLADHEGTVRLVDFWATWCAPCREEVPMLNELHAEYEAAGLRIVAIAEAGESAELVQQFVDDHGVDYLTLLGDTEVSGQYKVIGLPMAFLIDRDGRIVETYFGPKPRKALEKSIRELLDLPEEGAV